MNARHCFGEKPAVYEATGSTVGQALRRLGKHPALSGWTDWTHGSVNITSDEDGFIATLFVSK